MTLTFAENWQAARQAGFREQGAFCGGYLAQRRRPSPCILKWRWSMVLLPSCEASSKSTRRCSHYRDLPGTLAAAS